VTQVIDRITADYKKLDPANAAAYDQQKADFVANGLKQYQGLVAQIKQKYAGTAVGGTESIVSPLAADLSLKMLTPAAFLTAISEGNDPTAKDKATFDDQIATKQIQVLLFNTQNATPDVQRLVDAAKAKGIPIVSITETLDPATASFQDWQTQQLQGLADALAKATGR
jgi:zinc/manganese transport system substrate-binding protein